MNKVLQDLQSGLTIVLDYIGSLLIAQDCCKLYVEVVYGKTKKPVI